MLFETLSLQWAEFQKAEKAAVRILVVDDEPSLREILAELMSAKGYSVDGVDSFQEGKQRLDTGVYDLLIADKNLPDGSGVDLIRHARSLEPAVPSVMITGYPTASTVVEALTAGAADYIAKPFDDVEHLTRRLQSVLERRLSRRLNDKMVRDLTTALRADGSDRELLGWIANQLFKFKADLGKRPAVLLIEDNLAVADVIRRTLVEARLETEVATHFDPARMWLERHDSPLTALLSVDIPGAVEMVSELREIDPLLEVVVTSGRADTQLALAAVAAGAVDYALRPFEGVEVLQQRMQRAVGRARRRRLYVHLLATLYQAAKKSGQDEAAAFLDRLHAPAGEFQETPASLAPEEIDLSDLFEGEDELDITVLPVVGDAPVVTMRAASPDDEALPRIEGEEVSEDERRHDRRVHATLEVRFRGGGGQDFIYSHLRDLSSGGLFIQMDSPLEVGAHVAVELLLGWNAEPLHLTGEVVRSLGADPDNPGYSGIGVRLIEGRAALDRVIENLIQRGR